VARSERELAEEVVAGPPGRLAAVGRLLVPDEGMIPGFACDRCRAPSADRGECPDCGATTRPVPDLLEEMVQRTLDDDGQVTVVRDAPFSVAAKLRFPVTTEGSRR